MKRAILLLLALTGCVSMLPRRPQLSKADSYPPDIAAICQQAEADARRAVESVLGRSCPKRYGWLVAKHAAEGRNDEGLYYFVHPQLGRVGGTTLLGNSEVVCDPSGKVEMSNLRAEAVHKVLIETIGDGSRGEVYMECLRRASK